MERITLTYNGYSGGTFLTTWPGSSPFSGSQMRLTCHKKVEALTCWWICRRILVEFQFPWWTRLWYTSIKTSTTRSQLGRCFHPLLHNLGVFPWRKCLTHSRLGLCTVGYLIWLWAEYNVRTNYLLIYYRRIVYGEQWVGHCVARTLALPVRYVYCSPWRKSSRTSNIQEFDRHRRAETRYKCNESWHAMYMLQYGRVYMGQLDGSVTSLLINKDGPT